MNSFRLRKNRWLARAVISTLGLGVPLFAFAQDPSRASSSAPGSPASGVQTAPPPAVSATPTTVGSSAHRPAGAERTLSEQSAVERAVTRNPSLHVALLQASQAAYEVRAEEGLYSMIASAEAGLTHSRRPFLNDPDVDKALIRSSDTIDLGVGLTKPFSFGTVLGATVRGHRAVDIGPQIFGQEQQRLGPTYSIAGQLTLFQPLLRGLGQDVGLASLREARLRKTASVLALDEAASTLLRDVIQAYWELWYADQVIRISEASRDFALEQVRQAEEQARGGALAEIDVLTYRTRRAELDESVVLAVTDRRQRSLALGLLLGESATMAPDFSTSDPLPQVASGQVDPALAIAEAVRASPELARLKTQVRIAQDRLKSVGDPLRPRLDLDAYVQVQGLGNKRVPPALEQAGEFEAVSAHVGLTFEAPIDATRRRSQIASAQLARHIAEKQLDAETQQLRSLVHAAIAARSSAEQRVEFARETVKVAKAQAEAERRRLAAGISVALQVQEAENSLLGSSVRLERARVDWVLAEVSLSHLRGRLLERYRSVLARLPEGPPRVDGAPTSGL